MLKKIVSTTQAPAAIGPYSQAVSATASSGQGLLFISGQLGLDPKTGILCEKKEDQIRQAFANLLAILKEAGASLDNVLKLTLFLTDLSDFSMVNQIMQEIFVEPYPARSTIEVSQLPKGGVFEVEAIAHI